MKEKKPAPAAAWPVASAIGAMVLGVVLLGSVVTVGVVRLAGREQPQRMARPAKAQPEVIDLMALINTKYDSISGTWIHDRNTMDVRKGGASFLRIPIAVPAEYQLTMQVTRLSGSNTFGIGLVTSKSQVVACLDAHEGRMHTGLELLDRAYV